MFLHITMRSVFALFLAVVFGAPAVALGAGSLSLTQLSPSDGVVSPNMPVTFTLVPSGLISPTYVIMDDMGVNLTPNMNAFGVFQWTPYTRDAGTHNLTITASDSAGNSASVSQAIQVILPTATLGNLVSPTHPGVPVTFQITATGFTNPTYWLGDVFGANGTLSNSKLSSSGSFYWVPTINDIGTHKVTVSVSDSYGHYVELTQDFVVSAAPKPAIESLTPGTTTPPGAPVSFTVTAPGFTTPSFAVYDSYSPSTVSNANMTSAGVFTWTPVSSQTGTHHLRFAITGSDGRTGEVAQTIVVESPILSISDYSGDPVYVGDTVKFTVVSKGLSSPTYLTQDSRPTGTTVTNESTSASGLFVWMPTITDVGQHNIAINATDQYGNFASTRKDIRVAVRPITPSSTPVSAVTPSTSVSQTPSTSITQTAVINTPVSVAHGYVFTKALKVGSSGTEVLQLQKLLNQLGFLTVEPTGTFGPMTASAVKKFQSSHGLEAVGSVGPGTRAKLNATGGAKSSGASIGKYLFAKPLAMGATGSDVTELQKKLQTLGYYTGVPSGVFDSATVLAVKTFQSAYGLEAVGSVGPGTRAKLNAL
jgi:peptidoglycan hydrolase-like protein with peptidoglycan-binding domain